MSFLLIMTLLFFLVIGLDIAEKNRQSSTH
jgi:hypothetical protein